MVTYKQAIEANVPKGEFLRRFAEKDKNKANIILQEGTDEKPTYKWIQKNTITPWKAAKADEFPQFNFNQMSVKEFFDKVTANTEKNTYKGMIERIGRTIIWADDLADNEFLRFMKPPLEYGAAIESGAYDEITSRKWIKNYQSTSGLQNPLFSTQIPIYLNSVAEVNFSREIPLKMSEIEFKKCCQSAQTVGDVAGVLVGKINVTFIDDMYEACKQYFCGCLRITPEPQGPSLPFTEKELTESPMVTLIEYTGDKCPEDRVLSTIHQITDSEFYYKSRNYNPAGKYTRSKQMTLILPKKWLYPIFLEKWAATYHPEYIKLGEDVNLLYIDAMPDMMGSGTGMYPAGWELFGILVDDRTLGITPVNGGFTVNTFFNPQDGSTSYFGHYEFIFSFIPFFNRKYIFIKKKT